MRNSYSFYKNQALEALNGNWISAAVITAVLFLIIVVQ